MSSALGPKQRRGESRAPPRIDDAAMGAKKQLGSTDAVSNGSGRDAGWPTVHTLASICTHVNAPSYTRGSFAGPLHSLGATQPMALLALSASADLPDTSQGRRAE